MGFFITLDGLDASGKETQSDLLCSALQKQGYQVRALSFPMYGHPGAVPVELYLNGTLGAQPEDTNAFAASTFFSVDRYISYRTDWKKDIDDPNTIVVSNRYTTANAVHQLSKLPKEQWSSFLDWLWDFEFNKLGLPLPDMIFYLEMHPDISMRLLAHRTEETGRKQDIHETNKTHLIKSYEAAQYASDTLGWNRIVCHADNEPRPISDIHSEIMALVTGELLKKTQIL